MTKLVEQNTLQAFLDSHKGQWRKRLIEFLIPRVQKEDAETVLEMVHAAINQGHDEGLEDAIHIVTGMRAKVTDARAIQVLGIAERALSELRRRNAARPGSEVRG